MPNWCDCDLVIKSTKRAVEELKRFVEYAKDGGTPSPQNDLCHTLNVSESSMK